MKTQLLMETGVLCVPGLMSTCAACCDPMSEQERCRSFEKATNLDRCMHLVFGEFCDSMIAQAAARGQVVPFRKKKYRYEEDDEQDRREVERKRSIQRREIRRIRRDSW